MSVSILLVALLVGPPSPAPAPAGPVALDPLDHATDISNQQRPREAAGYAMEAFARTDLPRRKRLELALFAQGEYASLYKLTEDSPPGAPEDLCRALEILERAGPLVATDDERRMVEDWRSGHRSALQADYPAHACAPVGPATTARPEIQTKAPQPRGPAPTSGTAPMGAVDRRVKGLLSSGGTLLALGCSSFVVMAAALGVRAHAARQAEPFTAHLAATSLNPADSVAYVPLERSYMRAGQIAVITGTIGGVMLLTGSVLVARGHLLRRRVRALPTAGAGHAGLTVFGRF